MTEVGHEKKWGATIERGTLTEQQGEKFKVKSFDRDGIVSRPLKPIPLPPELLPKPYAVGDKVYFAMFCDGGGCILAPMEEE